MPTDKLPEIIDSLSKFVAANGVVALIVLIVALGILGSIFLLLYVVLQLIRLQNKAQDNSAKRDERIDKVSVRIEDVSNDVDKLNMNMMTTDGLVQKALDGLISGLSDINASMKNASKVTSDISEHMVTALNEQSTAIGISSTDIKKNSDNNTDKIINEINEIKKGIETHDGTMRTDLKDQVDRVIEAVQQLATLIAAKDTVIATKDATITSLTKRLADMQAVNMGLSVDPHRTEPLGNVIAAAKLSPVDGEANRKAIDPKPDDDPPPNPAGAIDPETGEAKKVA